MLVFNAAGFWRALLTAVLLSFLLWPGPAALFAVSASVLCFHYGVVGIWLPIASYLTAGIALVFDWNLSRAMQPTETAGAPGRENEHVPSTEDMNLEEWNRQLSDIAHSNMALRSGACRIAAWLAAAPHLSFTEQPGRGRARGAHFYGVCSVHGLWATAGCGKKRTSSGFGGATL